MRAVPPNWRHVLSCCAFAVPPGVAVTQMMNDAWATLVSGFAWQLFRTSFIVHPVVVIATVPLFLFIALRWREFYGLSPRRQWLVMCGCWLIDVEGFVLCMMMT